MQTVFIIPFLLTLLLQLQLRLSLFVRAESPIGLVRFCHNGTKGYEVSRETCPEGIFFNSALSTTSTVEFNSAVDPDADVDCICAQGSWYLQHGICTEPGNPRLFLYGNVTCFNPKEISTTIKNGGLSYIGEWLTSETDHLPLLLTSLTNGLLLRPKASETDSTYSLSLTSFEGTGSYCDRRNPAPGLTVIRLSPLENWAVTRRTDQFALCLRAAVDKAGKEVSGIFGYNVSLLCQKSEDTVAGNDVYLTFVQGCEYEDGNEWIDVTPFNLNASVVPEFQNASSSEAESCRRCLGRGLGAPQKYEEDCTPQDILERNDLEYNIDLQSSRLGLHLQTLLLKPNEFDRDRDLPADTAEIQLLTKASIMAYGACNMNIIPKEFYQYFLIMLKPLLAEAFTKYPPQTLIKGKSMEWIVAALDRCRLRTRPYDFVFEDTCPQKYTTLKRNRKEWPILLPQRFKADPMKHDYLIEFAWKLSSFLFYHCYAEFAEGGTYHYELRQQLESMFSDDLLVRWMNPSNSLKMYSYLFRAHINVTATMENFEYCVGAAHLTSKYAPNIWLKKPIEKPNGLNWSRQKREASDSLKLEPHQAAGAKRSMNNFFHCIENLETFLKSNEISTRNCW